MSRFHDRFISPVFPFGHIAFVHYFELQEGNTKGEFNNELKHICYY